MLSRTLKITLAPRILQFMFSLIIISLTGDIISTSYWNAIPKGSGNAAPVNYSMFLGVWVLVLSPFLIWAAFYLSPRPAIDAQRSAEERDERDLRSFGLHRILAVLDTLSVLFFVCGAIAMSAGMGIHSCTNSDYTDNNGITEDSPNTRVRCREAQAATAFLWFEFLAFAASLTLDLRSVYYRMYPEKMAAKHQRPAIQAEDDYPGPVATDMQDVEMAPARSGSRRFGGLGRFGSRATKTNEEDVTDVGEHITERSSTKRFGAWGRFGRKRAEQEDQYVPPPALGNYNPASGVGGVGSSHIATAPSGGGFIHESAVDDARYSAPSSSVHDLTGDEAEGRPSNGPGGIPARRYDI